MHKNEHFLAREAKEEENLYPLELIGRPKRSEVIGVA